MIDLYPVVILVHSVYVNRLYQQVVPESMKAAVECVKVSPTTLQGGEVSL